MARDLDLLIEKAKKIEMTPLDMQEQRISFAYGNTKIENDLITRETVRTEAERLTKKR